MTISWYPGHMNKARKELIKLMRESHAVLELLDARAPLASANPLLNELGRDLPRIRVLTKADLADPTTTEHWLQYFQAEGGGKQLCFCNGTDAQIQPATMIRQLTPLLPPLGRESARHQVLVTGIPNVGKSSLLNQLTERSIAKTGNEPAITRHMQRVPLTDTLSLIDTPGMMWPKFENQHQAYLLAIIGSIRNTAIDIEDIAWYAAEELLARHPEALIQRYGESATNAEALLTLVGRTRGGLAKGARPDFHRAGELLLNDLRSGKLGRLSLETPPAPA